MEGVVLNIIVLLTSLPIGWALAWLCKDELASDKNWLLTILICFFILAIIFFFYNTNFFFSMVYMIVVISLMLFIGKNKKFIRN